MSENLKKVVLVVEYQGANYCGYQFQENAPTIQAEIETALQKLTGKSTRIVAASRTDTGVHALGQIVSFRTDSDLKIETYIRGLNYYLPQDIAVKESYQVNDRFSVQREAVSREYHYLILNRKVRSPLKRAGTFQVSRELNLEAMQEAGQLLVGHHDLASFVTAFSESTIKSTFRTVHTVDLKKDGELVIFDIVARSFLPHQVRNTVGTLIRVGLNKISIDDFKTIMEAKKPGLAGPTVPAQGLYLIKVNYPRPLGEYHEDL